MIAYMQSKGSDAVLPPQRLGEFVGQPRIRQALEVGIAAAKRRGEAMESVLLLGAAGTGKGTLAAIIANELGVGFQSVAGANLKKKLDMSGILSGLQVRQVLFIDDFDEMAAEVREMVEGAITDFHLDILIGSGPGARMHSIPLQRFTLIASSTKSALKKVPVEKFGFVFTLLEYTDEEMVLVVHRCADMLGLRADDEAVAEIGKRTNGRPGNVAGLLRRVRDYAEVHSGGIVRITTVTSAMNLMEAGALLKKSPVNPYDAQMKIP
jgi:holliday junction DNA helicase RuvB